MTPSESPFCRPWEVAKGSPDLQSSFRTVTMPSSHTHTTQASPGQSLSGSSHESIDNSPTSGFLVILLFVSFALAGFGYKRHRIHRQATLLKRQIAMLEAMWQKSSTSRSN